MKPTVRLMTHTAFPLETIYCLWEASRHNGLIPYPEDVAESRKDDPAFDAEVRKLFTDVLHSGIPVAENVSFTFLLEDISIALREQLVRHRIGVKAGERLGCDIAPDLADSTFWSQSMRILDMGAFASAGRYDLPDSIAGNHTHCAQRLGSVGVYDVYVGALHGAEEAYRQLVEAGVPMEDARNVIPLAATHRISWTLNLAALKHIIGKRGCWILQLGIWEPIITGMVEELAKIDPIFRDLISPPCVKGNKFTGCCFKLDNERRIDGEDEIPPCALYLHQHGDEACRAAAASKSPTWSPRPDGPGWETSDPVKQARFDKMAVRYGHLWGRNVSTGVKV